MAKRSAVLVGAAGVGIAAEGGTWWLAGPGTPAAVADEVLFLPPLPALIAEGEDCDRCLDMVSGGPEGARSFA